MTPETSALLGRAERNLRAVAERGDLITLQIATMISSTAKFRTWLEYSVQPNAGELSFVRADVERAAAMTPAD